MLSIRLTDSDPPSAKSDAPEPATVMLLIVADSVEPRTTSAAVTVAPSMDDFSVFWMSLVETAAPTDAPESEIAKAPLPLSISEVSVVVTVTVPPAWTALPAGVSVMVAATVSRTKFRLTDPPSANSSPTAPPTATLKSIPWSCSGRVSDVTSRSILLSERLQRFTLALRTEKGDRHPAHDVFRGI